ncbi:DUF3370 family protein [Synechococcus elongatus]|uniref:Uncharacterized protein n=1 Tax=Synechococcus elongatus (strain ATCC 33912 / PCC 7942 / FACHB-805) TaxID=1140 RepID=Q31KY5_SYNE7|nr:DUF3370 family protein [Synechococcus elongatus]ABB58284.1 conserved hypothetical protein [Synechococcus elongatus PCC 7942 = FACHB-805]AJD57247.1 hypothetical protein M744_05050 [Synechococcus elongatus UTEX 2973]MBD2587007.1 DUF3370 family protein [Synechococcus elongatus FACHB-242]MBD2688078.1 DUF3370 family protein [Synechococcus elongatus FACHB-1061]MBD2706211.1 DUF3370 family protein [Synechococcus elongatus PCC 7942 = FACHB-805]
MRRLLPRCFSVLALSLLSSLTASIAIAQTIPIQSPVRRLEGQFNTTPVLHSNQPEIVQSEGILIDTGPGFVRVTGSDLNRVPPHLQTIANPTYAFNGPFGLHLHHVYRPSDTTKFGGTRDRGLLYVGVIATNFSDRPVRLGFQEGSLNTSFESPFFTQTLGVFSNSRWNYKSGPGDAAALSLLTGKRDWRLPAGLVLPPRSRSLLFSLPIAARGSATVLARGVSDGPVHLAVVATDHNPDPDAFFSVLDRRLLAEGRTYLADLLRIQQRQVFSRVGGVAQGDRYEANLEADLQQPLHVPLTTTWRKHFGTQELQANSLLTRMPDSALENIGTYGVEYVLNFRLRGQGLQRLLFSTLPEPKDFLAFRGTLRIDFQGQTDYVHLSQRSGSTDTLYQFQMPPSGQADLRVSLVYPPDSTPGHLLSIVPEVEYARLLPSPLPISPALSSQRLLSFP